MTTYVGLLNVLALTLISILAFPSFAEENEIALPGDRAYPESISAASNGTLYVGSLATGGVWRIKPQAGAVEEWIKPGAFGSRSILGVLVDEKANLLWVCSNDFSSSEIPGPSSVPGSFVNGFDLPTGEGKVSAQLQGKAAICNGNDGREHAEAARRGESCTITYRPFASEVYTVNQEIRDASGIDPHGGMMVRGQTNNNSSFPPRLSQRT
jgi:DNA-binding beta-propeller fold protein YncE